MPGVTGSLHPAENRGYRELYASARQLASHWSRLARRLPPSTAGPFERGVVAADDLISELEPLTASYGLHGKPAAQGVGLSFAQGVTAVRDPFLELERATRLGLLDLQHLTTLLGFLGAAAQSRGDERLREFCGRWERRLRRIESAARARAVELGADPDAAIRPFDPSPLGRAAQSVGYAAGAVGEWIDRQAGRRRSSP